jgi:hypothetical protein
MLLGSGGLGVHSRGLGWLPLSALRFRELGFKKTADSDSELRGLQMPRHVPPVALGGLRLSFSEAPAGNCTDT